MRYALLLRAYLTLVAIAAAATLALPAGRPAAAALPTLTLDDAQGAPAAIVPDQMALSGDVLTHASAPGSCAAAQLDGAAPGSIVLGANPTSCGAADQRGAAASVQIQLGRAAPPAARVVIQIASPERTGRGIRASERRGAVRITLDGAVIWDRRALDQAESGGYFAADGHPIQTTLVLRDGAAHTLTLVADAHVAWDIERVTLTAVPMTESVRGIGYSPYRDCQGPGTVRQPSADDIREDLGRLANTTNAIRTYASTGTNAQIPALAIQAGLSVYAGAWLDHPEDPSRDAAEIDGLVQLANSTPLAGAIVGNEFYLRNRSQAALDYLLQRIREVRQRVVDKSLPLMTAEIDSLIFDWAGDDSAVALGINPRYEPILSETDIVLVHIYPFWSGQPGGPSADLAIRRYVAMRDLVERAYPGQHKRVIIGETGWPSAGAPLLASVPSIEQQRNYLTQILMAADQLHIDVLYFDAFDELWKIDEPGLVGQRWGYAYSDRSAKHGIYGMLLPSAILAPHRAALPLVLAPGQPPPSAPPDASQPEPVAGTGPLPPVYTEWLIDRSPYVPVGFMGDKERVEVDECDRSGPHSGEMSIRASFAPGGERGWGGVSWQDPASRWGAGPGGHSMAGAKRITFWARGARGGEVVEFKVGGIGVAPPQPSRQLAPVFTASLPLVVVPPAPYPDSIRSAITTGPIVLSDRWEQYAIDLGDADLSSVVGGFLWVADSCHNAAPITFYLDDILIDPQSSPPPTVTTPARVLSVYRENLAECNRFAPSGFFGDPADLSIDPASTQAPHQGRTAMEISYTPQGDHGFAGIVWQHPDGNWGTMADGYDLRWANQITFWAKGTRGGERVEFFMGGAGDGDARYPDSQRPPVSLGTVILDTTWRQYTIDLRGADLSHVIGGFGIALSRCANPAGATFRLDDVVYAYNASMPPPPARGDAFGIYTDAGAPGNHYAPSLWMGDAEVPGVATLTECATDAPGSDQTYIHITSTKPAAGSQGWSGMYWVYPGDNIGDRPGGYDLTGVRRLTFRVRGSPAGAPVTFLIGGVGYASVYGVVFCGQPTQRYPNSLCPPIAQTIALSTDWQLVTIELGPYAGRDWRRVVGGFGWTATQSVTLDLDDITYWYTP